MNFFFLNLSHKESNNIRVVVICVTAIVRARNLCKWVPPSWAYQVGDSFKDALFLFFVYVLVFVHLDIESYHCTGLYYFDYF